jgi:uncharacterized membrane-anchored protein
MSKRSLLVGFVAAVVVQALILVAVPARKVYTLRTGKTVVLKIQPVDPYNILSGYYATLGFDISRVDAFPNAHNLTNESSAGFADGSWCYAVIEKGGDGIWKPVSLERELPANLPENRAALLGRINGNWIKYGIEDFYIPEAQRSHLADDLREHRDKARVEVKVDPSGHAALERLMVEDRIYE